MEAHLDDHSNDSAARIQALTDKHTNEIDELKQIIAKKDEEWSKVVEIKTSEISKLKGRLDEARSARESTLDEMKHLSKNYNNSINEMEESMQILVQKYHVLQKHKANIAQTHNPVEEKLRKSLSEKQRLSTRLEVASKETDVKQKKIDELDAIVTRLEESLNSLEQQVS